jgi:phosphate transport system substrate-binding protein
MKNRFVVLIAILLLAVVPLVNVTAQDQTILEVASGNADFSTLVSMVQAAGLADALSGEGPFTVFAPNNDAFAKLPQPVVDFLAAHPEDLQRVLSYHIIAGEAIGSDMAMSMSEAAQKATVEGSEVTVAYDGAKVMVNDALVVAADIAASNGVIHAIDQVILPTFALPEVIPATLTGDIVADGSSTVEPLALAAASHFADEGFGGNVQVGESGTGGGFKAFCEEGATDISNASRAIKVSKEAGKAEEYEKCLAIGRTPVEFRVGTDGLSLAVNTANDFATDLTRDEIKTLFSTAVKWSDVRPDFPAEDIIRYVPGTDSGTYDYFIEVTFAGTETAEAEAIFQAQSNLNQSESDNILVEGIKNNTYAVGFFGYAYYLANAADLKLVAVNGVIPTSVSVEDGSYAYARPLFVYSTADIMAEKPQVAGFINYILSNANALNSEVGYFPPSEFALNRARLIWIVTNSAAM